MNISTAPTSARAATSIPARTFVLVLALPALFAGCSFDTGLGEGGDFFKKIFRKDTYAMYRVDIQQGNRINPDRLKQLKPGMTKAQVRYLLGNPVADNVFHKNRWHYSYYLIPGKGETERHRLVLLFDGERLKRIHSSETLTGPGQKTAREEKS